MIAKGTTHNNGAKLAAYLTTAKPNERAQLWQLCGFAAGNIRDAFRDVHVMAAATKCEKPFMHVQVRNPEGETLTCRQWEIIANRIEAKLGMTGQPRAIAFHTNLKTGHEHMHVAWSRIDEDTLTARPVPFFKLRLKETARELEESLGLTRVRNERAGPITYGPTRAQEEQGRRLGVDIHEVRGIIRECWERSDSGAAFQAALAERGFVLAKGERRDFLVIDQEGGMHALGKRILGVSAAETRERLADLDRYRLPSVEQARQQIRDGQAQRQMDSQVAVSRSQISKETTSGVGKEIVRHPTNFKTAARAATGVERSARVLGKTLDVFANAFESIFAPIQTPAQKRQAAHATRERTQQAEEAMHLSRFVAEREQARIREVDKQHERERDGREL